MLAGVGFTVSLLIGELAYGVGSVDGRARQDRGARRAPSSRPSAPRVILRARNRRYREIADRERRDDDGDGIPDVFQE